MRGPGWGVCPQPGVAPVPVQQSGLSGVGGGMAHRTWRTTKGGVGKVWVSPVPGRSTGNSHGTLSVTQGVLEGRRLEWTMVSGRGLAQPIHSGHAELFQEGSSQNGGAQSWCEPTATAQRGE